MLATSPFRPIKSQQTFKASCNGLWCILDPLCSEQHFCDYYMDLEQCCPDHGVDCFNCECLRRFYPSLWSYHHPRHFLPKSTRQFLLGQQIRLHIYVVSSSRLRLLERCVATNPPVACILREHAMDKFALTRQTSESTI